MKQQQSGFTLIELVMVIVILGILAATALPRFLDISIEAGNAAAEGTAGALSSATAMNYAKMAAGNADGTGTVIATGVATCADLPALLTGGVMPTADLTITAPATVINCAGPVGAGGTSTACTVTHAQGNAPATITTICTQ